MSGTVDVKHEKKKHFDLIKTQISIPAFRKCDQASLDEIASMALYVVWMKWFLHQLNPASHTTFVGQLLDQAYDKSEIIYNLQLMILHT